MRVASAQALRPLDDLVDYEKGPVMWPVWDEKELEQERWNATDPVNPKSKDKTKFPFEDPAGPCILPPSLQHLARQQKRPCDIFPTVDGRTDCHVVAPDRFEKQNMPQWTTEDEARFARMRNFSVKDQLQEPEFSLVTSNFHLLVSEMMRWFISHCSVQQQEPMPWDAHTTRPWELIYPQGRDGRPIYNPGGKYAVRLFWLGTWRKVVVDDFIPMDATGKMLLPASSRANEIWPQLLCKAVCRIVCLSYEQGIGMPDFGDANILRLLTGWVSTPYSLKGEVRPLIDLMSKRCAVPPLSAQFTNANGQLEGIEDSSSVATDISGGMKKRMTSGAPLQRSDSVGKFSFSAIDSARRVKSGTDGDFGPPAATNRFVFVYAYYGADSPVVSTDVGLPGRLSHPVRVLSCHNVSLAQMKKDSSGERESRSGNGMRGEEYYNIDDWVLELQSPLVLYTGVGGHNNIFPHWKTYQLALGTSFEREHAIQALSLKLRGEGHPFMPFRFRMHLRDFLTLFKGIIVLQRETEFHFRSTILGSKDVPPSLMADSGHQDKSKDKDKEKEKEKDAGDANNLDLSHGRPWLLHNHSESSVDLLISLCVAQPRIPHFGSQNKEPRQPEVGTVELELFHWQTPASGKVALRLSTTGTSTVLLRLKPGRNVYRVLTHVPANYALTIMANKEFNVGDEIQILRQMGSCSSRFVNHAFGVIKAVKVIIGKSPSEAQDFIRGLASMHSNQMHIPVAGMIVFWKAMVGSLQTFLTEQWFQPIPDDPAFTIGEAWTMTCGDILKELVFAFGKVTTESVAARGKSPRAAAAQAKKAVKRMTRLKGAITIQRYFRGCQGRKVAQAMRQERIQRFRGIILQTWEVVGGGMIEFTMMLFRRIYDISPDTINLFPFAKDESLRCTVKDFVAKTEERAPGDWFVLSQDVVHFQETTTLAARMHIPGVESLGASFHFHIVDNDSGKEIPSVFNEPQPCMLKVNRRGYTFMVEGRTGANPLPSFPWGIRIISNPELPSDPARGGLVALSPNIPSKEYTGPWRLRKDGLLFKFRLSTTQSEQIASIHFAVRGLESSPATLVLEVFRGDKIILAQSGVLGITLPIVMLATVRRESAFVSNPDVPLEDEHYEICVVGRTTTEIIPDPEAEMLTRSAGELNTPKAGAGKRVKSGRKKGSKEPPQWVLRIFTKDPQAVTVATDAHREEEITGMKAMWEAMQPGRKQKGERKRMQFLRDIHRELTADTSSASCEPVFTFPASPSFASLPGTDSQGRTDFSALPTPAGLFSYSRPTSRMDERPRSQEDTRDGIAKELRAATSINVEDDAPPLSPFGSKANFARLISEKKSPSLPMLPVVPLYDPQHCTILDEDSKQERDEQREKSIEGYKEQRGAQCAQREAEKQARILAMLQQRMLFMAVQGSRSSLQTDILAQRVDYHRRMVEAFASQQQAQAAAQALVQAARAEVAIENQKSPREGASPTKKR